MGRKTFALTFYVRRRLTNAKGLAPIYMRITVNGVSTEMRVQRSIEPENWSAERSVAIGRDTDSNEINAYIDAIRIKVFKIQREMEADRKTITAIAVRDVLLGKAGTMRTVKDVFEDHNAQIKKLEGQEFTRTTIRRYEKSLEVLLTYIKSEYDKEDIELDLIDPLFIDKYTVFLKAEQRLSHNTVVKRLKNLKKITRIALINGWIKVDPFRFTKIREATVEREFLVKEEIERILAKEITVPRIAQVRDIYLFCVFSGLAFTDVCTLRPEHIMRDNNGDMWIRKARQKTKNMCNIPLLEVPLALIKKYKNDPGCLKQGTVLPLISNQKMNAYLKELADLCDINKHLTSHTARHTEAWFCLTVNELRWLCA